MDLPCSLKSYCERIPEENRWKLDKPIDFEHDGVSTHLGTIADSMDEWEGRVAEALGLNKVGVSGIKVKHPDNLTLQTREVLHHWQEKNGMEATYRNLIGVFLKAGKTSYAEAVCRVLGKNSKHNGIPILKSTLVWVTVAVLIVVSSIILLVTAAWFYYPQMKHQFDLLHSKTLPYRSEEIVGREEELYELFELIEFGSSTVRIVNIVGSPGFGKSTLAIHLGHKMVEKGVIVHYVNMAEISDRQLQQTLAEKLLESAEILSQDISFSRLLKWVKRVHTNSLLIFDNCDDSLHYQKEALQEAVDKIVESSNKVKIVMTSREITMHLHDFQQYKLYELSTKAACALLQQKVSHKVNVSVHEIETLAELAGNVPLALQIIGSLLLLPDPPTPDVIIKELKEQPIPTLSPEQLPKSQQINASLSLSYKYLSRELKMGGQYLAHFPGSFQKQAAATVFEGLISNTNWQINIHKTMQVLVQRSLLVYNQRTDRYNFHRLIREYFLDIQRHNHEAFRNGMFDLAFNHFYTDVLTRLANQFNNNEHIKALKTLDTEKHNFQRMFDDVRVERSIFEKRSSIDLVVIQGVIEATHAGLLKCRFADEEIADLLRSAIISTKYLMNCKPMEPITKEFHAYYSLIVQLASLEEDLHGIASAIQVYLEHETTFVIKKLYAITDSGLYISFYSKLAKYHFALGQHQEGILCHARIINDQSKQHLTTCHFYGRCQYSDIGMSYYHIGKYQEAFRFLLDSLQKEELGALNKVEIALLVLELKDKENVLVNPVIEQGNVIQFRSILASLKQITPIVLYQDCSRTLHIISLLWKLGHSEQAIELEEALLQVIKEIDIAPDKAMPWQTAYDVALHLFNLNRYSKVVELGTFLLKSMEQANHAHLECHILKPKLQMVVARSKFHAGNYSSGLDMMETVFNEIDRHFHAEEIEIACKYLLLRVRYINKCYKLSQNFANNVIKFGFIVLHITVVPLEIYHLPNSQSESVVSRPESVYPELSHITLSSETSLQTTAKNKDITADKYLRSLWMFLSKIWIKNDPKSHVLKIINTVWIAVTSSAIIRILLGIFLVWVRLFVLFYMFQLVCLTLRRVILVICILGVAFLLIPSYKFLISFTFCFLLILTVPTLIMLVRRNGSYLLYWSVVIFFLVILAIFGEKGSLKKCYRTMRDPRLIADCELH